MANSTTNIDTISPSQAGKEVTANAYFDAASPATIFGRRASSSSLLTWGYYGGQMLIDGVLTTIANGTVALPASQAAVYVEATRAGVVSANTTAFTPGSIPLYTIVTGATTVTSYTDNRAWVDPSYMLQNGTVSVTTADVTILAAVARCERITVTGAMTGNRALITPNTGRWTITNNCTGGYDLTVRTAGGTGVVVPSGGTWECIADGTNVLLVGFGTGVLNLALADANTTLTAAQFTNTVLQFTGTLTAQRNIVLPLSFAQYTVFNNTTGGFGLQFIGATGTGTVVAAGKRAIIYSDRTNVVRVTPDT